MMKTGRIKEWHEKSGFGYISRPGHEDVYIGVSDTLFGYRPKQGDEVAFDIARDRQGPRAKCVVRVERRRKCIRA